ncbi:unnamed protein product [Caenorhabditis auriculariae]|uniref:ANK_REP_REGION domain-containing protein n=1 Tax=Caenorhabditis auriculariae TaxID=2777116 RepID=A0A8S1H2H6_9PELO|nr:unnamed protein product [Caenorhabditis auriculariae]
MQEPEVYLPPEPLFAAVVKANFKEVIRLCEAGADVQQRTKRDGERITCLMLADYFYSPILINIFHYLVNRGLSVDATTTSGKTALHFAVEDNNITHVKALAKRKAKVTYDDEGNNPLFMAAIFLRESTVYDFLVEYVEDPKMRKDAIILRSATQCVMRWNQTAFNKLKAAILMEPALNEEDEIPPNGAYHWMREARDLEGIQEMEKKRTTCIYQCLLMRERILGQRNRDVRLKLVRQVGRDRFREQSFWEHNFMFYYVVSVCFEFEPELILTIISKFVAQLRTLVPQLRRGTTPHGETVQFTIMTACTFFNVIIGIMEEGPHAELQVREMRDWARHMAEFAIETICHIHTLGFDFTNEYELRLVRLDLARFIEITLELKVSVFHSLLFILKPELVRVFVDHGANVHAKNVKGRPILSALLRPFAPSSTVKLHYYLSKERWNYVRALLECGARLYIHRKTHSVWETLVLGTPGYEPLIDFSGVPFKLQDFAAVAVEDNWPMDLLEDYMPPYKMPPEVVNNCRRFLGLWKKMSPE